MPLHHKDACQVTARRAERDDALRQVVTDPRYYGGLLRAVIARTGLSPQEAQDIVQTIALRTLETAEHSRDYSSHPRAYALGIANNVILKDYRTQQQRRRLVEPDSASVDREVAEGRSVSSMLNCRETVDRILVALAELPLRKQAAIALTYAKGKAAREVACELGYAAHTVNNWLSEVRKLLREQMQEATLRSCDYPRGSEFNSLVDWAETILTRFRNRERNSDDGSKR